MSNNISDIESEHSMVGGANKMQTAYFCSECGNLYDITNTPPTTSDTIEVDISDTLKGGKTKTNIPQSKQIYFVCTTCGNTELVKPRTLIISKKSKSIADEYVGNYNKPENLVNIPTLPHTRDYVCPNTSCKTHANPELRDAIMSRIGNSFRVMYICTVCMTSWK